MIIGVIKPKGPTSNNILTQIKKISGIKKIGHAGTLDPLASGVLVVAISRQSTKKIAEEVKKEKEYIADITLGMESTTDDEQGEKTVWKVSEVPKVPEVSKVLEGFIGDIEQLPPIYSAIKINGKEAYKYAHKGLAVEMTKRPAFIKEIELLEYEYPHLKIRVVTGKGVYIRTLAKDIGIALGTGAYMSDLVRTRVGEFTLENSYTLEALAKTDFTPYKDPENQ
jgi:tRNA pseudouridine55 synthase